MNKLILDANAFIKEIDFHSLSNHYSFIIHEAIQNEIRDERARTKLNTFSYPLTKSVPSSQMIKLVKQFATQTCDIASLSPVDIEIIALALTIIESQGMIDKLHLQPLKPLEFNKIKNVYRGGKTLKQEQIEEENNVVNNEEVNAIENNEQQNNSNYVNENQQQLNNSNNEQQNNDNNKQQNEIEKNENNANQVEQNSDNEEQQQHNDEQDSDDSWEEVAPKHKRGPPKKNDDSESSGEEWINNYNINEKRNDILPTQLLESELKVAVLTTDFAMQNVLLQMGVPLISTEGYVIKSARRFILECHVCKTLVRDPTKLFCPGCGNNSLLKVSCSLESDGTIILYRKKNFKVSLRGTQYDIPKSQSKKDKPFIYCEDQLMKGGLQQQLARQKKQEEYRYKKVMKTYENGVGFEDVEFKQPSSKIVVGYGRLNPNDVNDMRKIKRNKKH